MWEALDKLMTSELLAYQRYAAGQLSKEKAQEMAEKHFAHLDLSPETKSKYQQNIADTIKMIYCTVEQSEFSHRERSSAQRCNAYLLQQRKR